MSSVRRTIEVLDLLAAKGALGVRAVSQQLSLPVGSVHRLMLDLAEENAVERADDGSWQLSYRLLTITEKQLENAGFPRLARPFCEAIAEATRETVNINILAGNACICLDRVRGSQGMQLDWPIGQRAPLHCGGSAKSILAFLDQPARERALAQPLKSFTAHTVTDPDALRVELDAIRERGYSVDNQEMVLGVFCVGMPIVDRAGRPIGAISISGPAPKAPGPALQPLIDMLGEATSKVSRRLGYAGNWPPRRNERTLS